MEDLNSQQIVLLTLLVSFVTSIATGIVTVSLLEQAPEPVTKTINRVVEKTVERIVEVDANNEPQEKIVETIIVKEEDLTIEAVENNSQSIVRVFQTLEEVENFVSIGVIVDTDGGLLISSSLINETSNYIGKYPDGTKYNLEILDKSEKYSLMKIPDEQGNPGNFKKIKIGNSSGIKLGQSVIALSGQDSNSVSTGIITSLNYVDIETASSTDSETFSKLDNIETSVNPSKIISGAILLNLQGDLIGFKKTTDVDFTTFTPSEKIRTYLDLFNESVQ